MYAIIEKLAEGSGGPSPRCGDKAVVHYSGWLANKPNDAPFDSSREKGHAFTFAVGVGKVLPGWDEAVQAMVKGARWRIHIPCEHAYGPRGRPPKIPPAADLIFDIELLNINETLVEEGMRIRREEAARADHFLRLQDEARATEAAAASARRSSATEVRDAGSKRDRDRDDDDDSSSSSSGSSSDSEAARKRRKRERKERKKEKKERKKHKKHKSSGKKKKKKKGHSSS